MSDVNLEARPPYDRAIIERALETLKPYARNARTHSKKQLQQIAVSIERFGFVNPVLIGDDDSIIAGHGRVAAAKLLGRKTVPTLKISNLTDAERRAYILADNKLALNAGWDNALLALELQGLLDDDFDLELTGFDIAEIDFIIEDAANANPHISDPADYRLPTITGPAVTRMGDLWCLDQHKLICGDAQDKQSFERLVGTEEIDLLFTDPPYNVKIDGNVCGLGSVKHREFAFASGEMSENEFTDFLTITLRNASNVLRDGAIAYVCMDWRHMSEMLAAGKSAFTELKNLVIWNKTNGGMGAFYRSKHELIFVFKKGTAPHINSFGLGETGRYRTNVWDYAGISSISANRGEELAMHPTVKPVAMIADAIKDCSKRGGFILDCFGGSRSTLIAAQKTGRRARLIEYDPLYCDTIIQRWQQHSGKRAILAETGQSFEDVSETRLNPVLEESLTQ